MLYLFILNIRLVRKRLFLETGAVNRENSNTCLEQTIVSNTQPSLIEEKKSRNRYQILK